MIRDARTWTLGSAVGPGQRPRSLPSFRARQRGSMLIVALAVLVLLTVLAVTFAALMRLEWKATTNFSNRMRGEFVASSAESTLVAMMRGGLYWSGFTDYRKEFSPWLYRTEDGELAYGGLRDLETIEPEASSLAANMGSLYLGGPAGYFRTKIIDTSAQININSLQVNLGQILDSLGAALRGDPNYGVNPFYTEANEGGRLVTGREILRYRDTLEGNQFHSKAQLKVFIGEQNFRLLEDFVTTHSWIDPNTYRSADGIAQTTQDDVPQTAVNTGLTGLRTEITGAARLVPEPRAPINVNTAPEPVLVAVLTGLGGRRAYPVARIRDDRIEGANLGLIELEAGDLLPAGREELFLRPSPVWVYTDPLSIDQARAIAKAIISRRKAQPFTQWRSGSGGAQSGFEEFVNELPESSLPSPSTMAVLDPVVPRDSTTIKNALLFGGSGEFEKAYSVFQRGNPTSETEIRRLRGMSRAGRNAWYWETMRGVLSANFNPNTRTNKYNPNATAYAPVDKFGLVKLSTGGVEGAQVTEADPLPGHTTDFCFDATGIFEVTTLAEVAQPDASGRALAAGERIAEVKRRTIVQVWDVLRHTTQEHFEKPFRVGSFSSVQDRQYVTTYPDPMLALHPDLYHGSTEDGRVELAGYVDALRDLLEPNQRENFFQGRGGTLMYQGFRYRNERSSQQLLRMARGGDTRTGLEYLAEMTRVLDPEFNAGGSEFGKRYSSYNWQTKDSVDEDANIDDLAVDVAGRGTDIYPDGINSSMFRSSAVGARFLRYPASRYRQNPQDIGEMRGNYSNNTGILPYLRGGVDFWVKLEFNGDDPVFCGLIGATNVQWRVGTNLNQSSEGTQLFVYKSTAGVLRITRLYYHQAFEDGRSDLPLPVLPEEGQDAPGGGDIEEMVDQNKAVARRDVLLDISNWRAHEWHHLAIAWNDSAPDERSLRVYVDFEEAAGAQYFPLGEGQFVTLNEQQPKDGIFVGGFYRKQAVAQEGLFKFGTNWSRTDGTLRSASIKRVLANATIDEFRTFDEGFVAPFGRTGYFTDKRGVYTNLFEIPLADGIQRLRLRSLAWSVYPPALYNSQPVQFDPNTLSMSVANVGRTGFTLQQLRDPGGDARENVNVAGAWLYGRQAEGSEGRLAQLVYQVGMRGGLGSGALGGRVVATPVLDDVTLTYYLPTARILLSENLE